MMVTVIRMRKGQLNQNLLASVMTEVISNIKSITK